MHVKLNTNWISLTVWHRKKFRKNYEVGMYHSIKFEKIFNILENKTEYLYMLQDFIATYLTRDSLRKSNRVPSMRLFPCTFPIDRGCAWSLTSTLIGLLLLESPDMSLACWSSLSRWTRELSLITMYELGGLSPRGLRRSSSSISSSCNCMEAKSVIHFQTLEWNAS